MPAPAHDVQPQPPNQPGQGVPDAHRPSILYVSDLTYPARGRRYSDEDIYLTSKLRQDFDLAVCHPADATTLMTSFDTVVVRNSGPVIDYPEAYEQFREQARATGQSVYNPLTGKADNDVLIQPRIDFRYEVSFYFVDRDFQYALNAPDPAHRWELTWYEPSVADLEFARKFIDWNGLGHGVQRVDACRTQAGDLLLVELEDLNPYLSLDRTTERAREGFVKAMTGSIRRSLG